MKTKYRQFTEEELKWIKSFRRVMKKAPSSLFMYVTGDVNIHPLDENNKPYMDKRFGGFDSYAPVEQVKTGMMVDGGDY